LQFLPGQYCKLQFRGFPARCYSPSYPLEGAPDDRRLYFQIRRLPDGVVSSALGQKIRIGHRVRLAGPFGSAFLRPNHSGRILLVASGTGFAPIWSIAVAAIMENPRRDMMVVVATRTLQSFYMHAALCRLALFPNVKIIPVVSEPQNVSSALRSGLPTDYLPSLTADDVVYTCGAPGMTEAVARIARAAGAPCYTDPFVANLGASEDAGLMGRVAGWFDSSRRNAEVARVA
jgi:3-phenylpropionate/trans-cinnamate dioxygenase ferredoxin reductase subunit